MSRRPNSSGMQAGGAFAYGNTSPRVRLQTVWKLLLGQSLAVARDDRYDNFVAKMNMNAAMDHRISKEIGTFGDAGFNKDRIVAKVVGSYGRLPSVKGLDLGKILQSYVRSRVTAHLQGQDKAGWRVFECYRAGSDW